jgi:hypothetical protein
LQAIFVTTEKVEKLKFAKFSFQPLLLVLRPELTRLRLSACIASGERMEEKLPQLKLQELKFGSPCELTVAQLAELTSHCPELQRLEVKSYDGKVHLLSELTDGWLDKVLRSMCCCPEIACLKLEKVVALLKTMGQLRKKGHPTSSVDG